MSSPVKTAAAAPAAAKPVRHFWLMYIEDAWKRPLGQWNPLAYAGRRDMNPGKWFSGPRGQEPSETPTPTDYHREWHHLGMRPAPDGYFVPPGKCLWSDPRNYTLIADIEKPQEDRNPLIVQMT